jgi:predicted SAM-dependent methyltransferase
MKLHVGCGPKKLDGYRHQDVLAYGHVDYVSPAWSNPEPNETFDEVYARHLLEHLYPWEASRTLTEWHRILKPDGILHLLVPDLEFHCRQLTMEGPSPINPEISNFDHAMAGFYGWVKEDQLYMAHRWGYTRKTLPSFLGQWFNKIIINPSGEWEIDATATGKV